jgi:cytochrome oxidase assembly protein ShyY1
MNRNSKTYRWGSWILTGLIFATACLLLSQWQFARADQVHKNNLLVAKNYDAVPVPIEALIKPTDSWNPDLEYRVVSVSGNYLPKTTLLVRNRPLDGNPGFLQLVCFKTDSGNYLWIERGWLASGAKKELPDSIPQVDGKSRKLVLHLRKGEKDNGLSAPIGQLSNINLLLAGKDLPVTKTYLQAYARLKTETPELSRGLALGKPELSEGNHLSYAFQWIIFGLMALGAVGWNISQDRRIRAGQPIRKLKILNRDKDAEIEDQILDEKD